MKSRLSLIVIVMAFVGASVAWAEDVTVLTTFPGDSGPGPKDCPDNTGAVGPNHAVDFTDANYVVHDKKTGKVLQQMTQTEFWKGASPTLDLPSINDPRMLYDPLCQRFFAVASTRKPNPTSDFVAGHGYLAVSQSDDPTKGWKGLVLPMKPNDLGLKLGVDKNGLYMTFIGRVGDTHTMHDGFAIPMADAIAPDGPNLAHIQSFSNLEIECFPATDLDPNKAADAPEILLNHEFGREGYSKLFMYKITWNGTTAAISPAQSIPLSRTYIAPNGSSLKNQATQPPPGDKLRADEGRRTTSVFAYKGSIFSCNEAKAALDTRPGIFWCEIRASDGAILQEALVDSKDCDYLAPSLALDSAGNIGIGCTRTSATEFPSVCVMMHAAGDAKNSMRPPVLAAKGTTVFNGSHTGKYGNAWGNYNATCQDPSDPTILWTYQEYATSSQPGVYGTAWVAFKLK